MILFFWGGGSSYDPFFWGEDLHMIFFLGGGSSYDPFFGGRIFFI